MTREDVADASAIASALGARLLLDRIAFTSARLTPVERGSAEGLTPRELEVLGLVAQGLTDADVAARLFISPRTVGQHLRSIYGKLDVTSRVGATRFAVDHGLA